MENQTLCSVEDKLITGKRESELTLVHETSHHWWGNLITPMGWNHTWLNEGFATYAEALYLEHTGGRDAYNNYIGRVMAIKPGQLAGSIIGQTDTLFWDSFSSRVYFKGALVLHMLRSMIGDSEFFSVMRNYLNNPRLRYGNARTEDFIAECEHVHMQSLKWFFDQWVYTKTDSIDRPEIEYQWTSEPEATSYKVTLNLTQKNASTIVYRLPLSIDIKSEATSSSFPVVDSLASQSFTFTVSGKPVSVEIDKEHKIFKTLTLKN
jgi:aminopeptidase N